MTNKKLDRGGIYLSGGMQFAKNLGAGWRETTSKVLAEQGYLPLDITELDVAYMKDVGKPMLDHKEAGFLKYKAHMRKHFIKTDLDLIKNHSDALIVYYDESARRGAGTVSEAQYAFNKNIPIFLVADYKTEEELCENISGWLIALSTKVFLNFDDLYQYLAELPYGILKKDRFGNHCAENKYLCHLSGNVFEKNGNKFVSEINPLYSAAAVDVVHDVYQNTVDRYEFFMDFLEKKNIGFNKK